MKTDFNQTWYPVDEQIYYRIGGHVWNQVMSQVWSPLWEQIDEQVGRQVRSSNED